VRFTALFATAARIVSRRKISGNVDVFSTERLTGWIINPEDSGTPVRLSLHIDGVLALNILADQPRADVLAAGLGPLHCGYDVSLPRSLRDGRAHVVEVRRGARGPVLWKGRRKIAASEAGIIAPEEPVPQAVPVAQMAQQGVAYLDRRRAAIAGWATGCGAVTLRLGENAPISLTLDRVVPGLGGGAQQGFFYPLPPALLDGTAHQVEVSFQPGGAPLDGSPVSFQMHPGHPLVEIVSLVGNQLRLRVRDASGAPTASLPIRVMADAQALALRSEAGLLVAELPATAQELVLLDDASTPPDVLARYRIAQGQIPASDTPVLTEQPEVQAGTADVLALLAYPQRCAEANRAFVAFCAQPDARFDALWYQHRYMVADPLAHYAQTGAQAGCAPGPFFDEAGARLRHPALAAAIAAGDLPCAFALELLRGEDDRDATDPFDLGSRLTRQLAAAPRQQDDDPAEVLRALSALDPGLQTPRPATAIKPQLPAATTSQSAADSIYAAWFARLAIDAKTRAALQADEAQIRQNILATGLTRTPLISIIMPSYNRAYTIGDAIQSVLDQSYQNWELLVCDDASDDKTAEVLRGFNDPRIRYMQFTKSNGAGTRNKGLRLARGEYISYLDSDNIWHPLFLDLMLRQLMAAPGSAIAYSAYLDTEIVGAKVELHKISRTPFRPIPLSSRNFMDLNAILHHRRVYDWMGGFDESLPRLQDWDLMLRYTSIFNPVFVDHAAVFYRRNVAWGQVTHLFQNSGAQNTVNDKTNRRLTQGHERLQIGWPGRGRITLVLGGTTPGNHLLALNLARQAASVAEVDLLDLTGMADLPLSEPDCGIHLHRAPASLQRDPYRLSHAMAHLLRNRALLSVGLSASFLQAIPGVQADLCYRLVTDAQGLMLKQLGDAQTSFHLGALPLDELPRHQPDPTLPLGLLLLPGRSKLDLRNVAAQAKARNLIIVIPPSAQGSGGWQSISAEGLVEIAPRHGALPAGLAQCSMAASLQPISALPAFEFCLLNALQAQGLPLAVPREGKNAETTTELADQWIDARAAYEIKVATPAWVFDKMSKLHSDRQSYDTLAARGNRVHQIHLHPELCQQRLMHLLYRLLYETPVRETLHVDL